MTNNADSDEFDDSDNFLDGYEMKDSDSVPSTKKKIVSGRNILKTRKNARRRIEDYFERKALKEKTWDLEDELSSHRILE